MIQIIEGKIKQYSLPNTGTLSTGETVSGYHLLDEETLKDEGWLPLEDIPPEYDEEIQYLANDGYEILEDKVIKKYRIEEISEREEPRDLEQELDAVSNECEGKSIINKEMITNEALQQSIAELSMLISMGGLS